MKPITTFQLVDHGIDSSDYFQGCGIAFTEFTDIATGCGSNPKEAIDDALEQLAMSGWDTTTMDARILEHFEIAELPQKPEATIENTYYYVSVRVR